MNLLRSEFVNILETADREELPIRDGLHEHLDQGKDIVLFGAGNLGRQLAEKLLRAGVNVLCFCDNRESLWGSAIHSLPVLSPADAVPRYGASAYFVVAIWHPCQSSDVLSATEQLGTLGAQRIAPFSFLLERFPVLMPRLFWGPSAHIISHAGAIEALFNLLGDDLSRQYLLNALRLRLFHDFKSANHVTPGRQYFPHDIYSINKKEVFVDCGAFDGDSLEDFLKESAGQFRKVIAFEADPHNFKKLQAKAKKFEYSSMIDTRQCAVGAKDGTVRFAADGVAAASVCEHGGIEVDCWKLDSALAAEHPTIIKMDIEGAEGEALTGAGETINRQKPLLAVCVYHRPEDLWALPAQMHTLAPESRLYMRAHCADGFDLVTYAVPPERLQ